MDAYYRPDRDELAGRLARLFAALEKRIPDWETALISGPVNLYYLTGTMEDSLLVLKRSGAARLFVRRSCSRALAESAFPDIVPMRSYAQVAADFGASCGVTVLEKEQLTLKMLERLQGHLQLGRLRSLEPCIDGVRAVKSAWELEIMETCGRIHARILDELVPELLTEGITENEFGSRLYERACELGYQGTTRFNSRFASAFCCQFGFGENTLLPTSFDSPGGMKGECPGVPGLGDRYRKLRPGDLVMADFGCGLGGYQTDRTQIYCFRDTPSPEILAAHRRCRDIALAAAAQLVPGNTPEAIYRSCMPAADDPFTENFMGVGREAVHFLGHSIGLTIDERPAIARSFTEPLQENMTFAIEPKKGIPGRGFVGVEDTFAVTPEGGRCLTGQGPRDIIVVP